MGPLIVDLLKLETNVRGGSGAQVGSKSSISFLGSFFYSIVWGRSFLESLSRLHIIKRSLNDGRNCITCFLVMNGFLLFSYINYNDKAPYFPLRGLVYPFNNLKH